MCVFGDGFFVRPANAGWGCSAIPGWGVGVCVLVCALRLQPANFGWVSWFVGVGSSFGIHLGNPGWGVRACVFVCALRLYSVIPGSGVRCGCVCLGSRFRCAPPFLARGLAAFVFVCSFRLYPANPGWGVRSGCVCLGPGFGCAPQLLAGVLGCVGLRAYSASTPPISAGVRGACVWVQVLAFTPPILARVLGCVCLCAHSACTTPILGGLCGVGVVCLGLGFGCASPRHSWLGCWGVCVGVRAPPLPRLSWLWFVVPVRRFGFWLSSRKSRLGCWGVCVCVRAPPVPRHFWLGCALWVPVLASGVRLRPAIPGLGGGLCVLVYAVRLYPANPGSGVRCWCVCLGSGFGCAPPFLAGELVCLCVCWCARCTSTQPVLASVRGVCVSVRALAFTPPVLAGVLWCVCLCAHSACTPPSLAVVCGMGVCAWARVWAAPRHSWLGCWVVCVGVCAPAVRGLSWLGFVVFVCQFGLGLSPRHSWLGW